MNESGARESSVGVHRAADAKPDEKAALAWRLARRLPGHPRIAHRGPGERPEVALTFDDGPSSWTAEVASELEAHGCRGTFFLCGASVERRSADVAALARAGHELGNHLWSHQDPAGQSRREIRAEIRRTAEAIRVAGGYRPRLVRPPYCRAPHAVADAARWTGVRMIVQRSVGSGDWAAADPAEIYEPLLECLVAGDIVNLHDGVSPDGWDSNSRDVTVAAVRELTPGLLRRGLRPVTVSQLLARGSRSTEAHLGR